MAKDKESTKSYVVLPNNSLRHGHEGDGKTPTFYEAGDKIDLTEKEAAALKHAVGTPAEAKKAEAIAEAQKLLDDEERQKAEAAKAKK